MLTQSYDGNTGTLWLKEALKWLFTHTLSLHSIEIFLGFHPDPIPHWSVCGKSTSPAAPTSSSSSSSCSSSLLCTDSCSHGQSPLTPGQAERRDSGRPDLRRREPRIPERRGRKARRCVPVPLRGIHRAGQRHVPHVPGHRQNPTW